MQVFPLDVGMVKTIYNWYHKAYPDYTVNDEVEETETIMMKELEEFLITNDEQDL